MRSQAQAVLVVFASLVGWGVPVAECDAGQSRSTVHPTRENMPRRDAPRIATSLPSSAALDDEARAAWEHMKQRILNATPVLALGADAEGPELFGSIMDVAVDGQGNMFVFDVQGQEVHVFDRDGSFVQVVGGRGDGPSEFRSANGVEASADGRLLVSDRGNRLKIFGRDEQGYDLAENVVFPVTPESMCLGASGLFVSGWSGEDETVIHRVPLPPDTSQRSFGAGYRDDDSLVRQQLSDGIVGCMAGGSRAVFAFQLFPIVQAFDVHSGEMAWESLIEDFRQMNVRSERGPPAAVATSRNSEHEIVGNVVAFGDDYVLLQTGLVLPQERRVVVRTYLVDAQTGFGGLVADDLPRIMAPHADRYVAVFEEPFPRLEVRAMDTVN